ncbi:MAG: hypothetical protein IK125_07995 [Lachnospiraceae bacterium]|nr:hypothetical protein [Lachnospiraceae bacterium]
MKKSKRVLLALGLSLGLTACGSKDETKTTTVASNVADVTTAADAVTAEATTAEVRTGEDPQGAGTSIFDTDVSEYIDLSGIRNLEITTKRVTYKDKESLLYDFDEVLTSELGITAKDKDCPAKEGDLVTIQFSSYENNVPIQENYNMTIPLDASEIAYPEFIEHIVGKYINDEFEFTVSYPKDFEEPIFAGKEVVFKMSVENIIGPSTVSDEKIKKRSSGKYETCQAFYEAKVEDIIHNYRNEVVFNEIKSAVREKKPHEGMINEMIQKGWASLDDLGKEKGVDRETILQAMGYSAEEFENKMREEYSVVAREKLIVLGICRQEGYEITDAELSELKQKMIAEKHLASETELLETVTEDELKWQLYYNKFQDYLDNFKTVD